MLLGVIPALIVGLALVAALVVMIVFADDMVSWATPFADGWADLPRDVLRVGLYVALIIGTGFLGIVTFTGLTLAVGDPFYERIWSEVEQMLGGVAPSSGLGWIRGARDGIVLVGLGLVTSIGVFAVGFIPVIGTIGGVVAGLLVSGRLLAGELISRPLEARGMDRSARAALLRRKPGVVLGFGVSVQACFLVPGGAILVMPAAVAGATMLARDLLDSVDTGQ